MTTILYAAIAATLCLGFLAFLAIELVVARTLERRREARSEAKASGSKAEF